MQLHPYLFFEGRCEEAIGFYRQALGAEVQLLLRYRESPDPGVCPRGGEEKVMHASLRIGASTVLVSDGRCSRRRHFHGFAVSLTAPTDAEAERCFMALAERGTVQVALTPTFFATRFGMVEDRFGVLWMVSVPKPEFDQGQGGG